MSRSVEDLAMMMLDDLPSYRGGEARSILDHSDVWQQRSYRGCQIQDGLEWLWAEQLLMTDDPDSPPIFPRASVLFRSGEGDAVIEANHRLSSPQRLGLGLARVKARRGWKSKEMAAFLSITEGYLSQTLRGNRDVKLSMLDRICGRLGVPVHELLAPDRSATAVRPRSN